MIHDGNRTISGPEENVTLEWAIAELQKHRATHVDWRDWFRAHPDDPRAEHLGNADFHNEVVQRYNSILAVLETLLDTPAEVAT